jgi:alpha-mannosidase
MPESHSFLQLPAENVVFTAAKKAEDDNALILRFYEWAGKESDVTVRPNAAVESAAETDLIERPLQTLPSKDGVITIHTKPYEIKTLKVQLREAEPAHTEYKVKP